MATDDGLALVDSGMRGNARGILEVLESLGRQPGELRYIVPERHHDRRLQHDLLRGSGGFGPVKQTLFVRSGQALRLGPPRSQDPHQL